MTKKFLPPICLLFGLISCSETAENNSESEIENETTEEVELTEDETVLTVADESFQDGPIFRDRHPQTTALIKRNDIWIDFDTPAEAFDSCLSGDHIFIRSGEYILEESLELWEKDNVVVTGEGNCKLVMNNQEDNVMWITTCQDVVIRNLHCTHTKPSEWEQCTGNVFALDMGRNITIENCNINGCGAIGVYIFGTKNVTLKNNFIHDNSLWAIDDDGNRMQKVEKSENVTFINNRFENNGYRQGKIDEGECESGE